MTATAVHPTESTQPTSRAGELTDEGSTLRHAIALAKRSLIKTWRTPEALVDVTLQPVIFILMFTYIFGGAIAGGSQHEYLQFLLPGVLGQTIAMAGIALGVNLNTDIEKGVFDRFRSLPISRSAPLVGAVLADVVRYLILFVMCLGTGLIVGFHVGTNPLAVLAALGISVAFALCFCWISVWVGMIARTSGAVQGIMFLLVLPLSFVSNAFVPTATMPSWLAQVADVNPISHLVGTVRGLMVGGPVASNLLWTLGWMAVLLLVFVPLALRAYRRRA
ncbi:ABC transporter permease [Segeticoccus rhizosphaerae]|jgi:oleandomycin transport system permease protein|uniref:ABC transporter permease n=1 Tax=Segeticoccus rhizosphaerae TaxID=1104777 RepID=UPI0010C033ED|nr:ABC transporter permease [Ornithinicoccus soli]